MEQNQERLRHPHPDVAVATHPEPYYPSRINEDIGVSRSMRTQPPADYIFEIQNYSIFAEAAVKLPLDKLQTRAFEAGGYNWKLHLYPHGDLKTDADASDHISVNLVLEDREILPIGWEINVNFRLFLYDHNADHYLTLQDIEGRVTRFNQMRVESGFAKFISHTELFHRANGYWIDDSIIIGAEVFVIGNKRQLECLSAIWWPAAGVVSSKLSDFSKQRRPSHVLSAGRRKWKLEAYIEEVSPGKNGLKINLRLLNAATYFGLNFMRWFQKEEAEFFPQLGDVYAEIEVRVRNQKNESQHIIKEGHSWFRADSRKWGSWDCTNVISLSDLTDETKGYIVNDTLIIDVSFGVIREIKNVMLQLTDPL